jgi:hypothetical protein
MHSRAVAITTLVLGALACSKGDPARTTPPSAGTAVPTPAPPVPQSSATSPAPTPAPQATPAMATTSAPPPGGLASSEGEMPGSSVVVNELKRGPNTVTLKFTMINSSPDKDIAFDQFHEYGIDGNSVSGVHLIDAIGKKKYFVQRDADNKPLCSGGVANVAHGGQVLLWAKFPAPPDDVQRIGVEIPHFIPIEDVPISR